MELSIACWNVLAEVHVREAWYAEVEAGVMEPRARRQRVAETVAALVDTHSLDVVVLQECDLELWGLLSRTLPHLDSAWVPKGRGHDEGSCALVTRSSPWRWASQRRLLHSDGSGHVTSLTTLVRDGVEVVVASAHVRWADASTPAHAHVGVGQARELCALLAESQHVVVCGDVNDETGGPVRQVLSTHGLVEVAPGALTAWVAGRAVALDTIAVRGGSAETLDLGGEVRGVIPSRQWPSDHAPLAARVRWREP